MEAQTNTEAPIPEATLVAIEALKKGLPFIMIIPTDIGMQHTFGWGLSHHATTHHLGLALRKVQDDSISFCMMQNQLQAKNDENAKKIKPTKKTKIRANKPKKRK